MLMEILPTLITIPPMHTLALPWKCWRLLEMVEEEVEVAAEEQEYSAEQLYAENE